ncbi:hypothetical protein MPSEU_000671100 [Mayamaea pseudoterrestris]|nr:hypothetical protein MPSEU_000671100 [Mayamaea pseudoterrestris]
MTRQTAAGFKSSQQQQQQQLFVRRYGKRLVPCLLLAAIAILLLHMNMKYYKQATEYAASDAETNERRFQAFVKSSSHPQENDQVASDVIHSNQTAASYTTTTRPPLSSLHILAGTNIIGNVQFLLDFVIIGFAKCGTTSILKWLDQDARIATFPDEVWSLKRNLPHQLVRRLYYLVPVNRDANDHHVANQMSSFYKRGYKNPAEVTDTIVLSKYYRKYWPQTRLIVSVRHPYEWFVSLYNFRVQNLETIPSADRLVGPCFKGMKSTCTHKGNFAYHLMRMGKQNYKLYENKNDEEEQTLPFTMNESARHELEHEIVHFYKLLSFNHTAIAPLPNSVFIMDVSQLSDANDTRRYQFRQDVTDFLQLNDVSSNQQHKLLPDPLHAPRVKPGRTNVSESIQATKAAKRLTMQQVCHDAIYESLRAELLRLARTSSLWIRHVFLKSPGVYCSDESHLQDVLAKWMVDPCVSDAALR